MLARSRTNSAGIGGRVSPGIVLTEPRVCRVPTSPGWRAHVLGADRSRRGGTYHGIPVSAR
jgi:hypothetical protein